MALTHSQTSSTRPARSVCGDCALSQAQPSGDRRWRIISKSLAKDAEPAAYDDAESAGWGDAERVLSGMAVQVNRTKRPLSIPRSAQRLDLSCEFFGRRDAQDLIVDADNWGLGAQAPAGRCLDAEKAVRGRLPVPHSEVAGKDLQELT